MKEILVTSNEVTVVEIAKPLFVIGIRTADLSIENTTTYGIKVPQKIVSEVVNSGVMARLMTEDLFRLLQKNI